MSNVTLELNPEQVENLVEKLTLKDKMHLAQKLNLLTWQARFKNVLSRIDKRRPSLSNEEIVKIVKKVRKRSYAQSRH